MCRPVGNCSSRDETDSHISACCTRRRSAALWLGVPPRSVLGRNSRPQPVSFSDRLVRVNVPRLLFVPADTVVRVVEAESGADSVQVEIQVRTLEYRDSAYYARVSGPVVGNLAPRLDWIETYNRTITRTVTKRSRFAVTAGVGIGYTPQGFQPTIGVQAGVVLWSF